MGDCDRDLPGADAPGQVLADGARQILIVVVELHDVFALADRALSSLHSHACSQMPLNTLSGMIGGSVASGAVLIPRVARGYAQDR
jgi:hypothetical protein